MSLTSRIIEMETVRIARYLHIVNHLHIPVKCELNVPEKLYCLYFPTYEYVINFTYKDLLMSIDDFRDKILILGMKQLLSNEQKFIHEDCS